MFEKEGFSNVYEWDDPAGTEYPLHAHKGKVSILVTDGSCVFKINGEEIALSANERLDIPVGVEHTAVVGQEGWRVIVGEEIEGDS